MTILDKVIQMQQSGTSDVGIMAQLQNEGISPSEISDAINQAKIKNAISPTEKPTPQEEQTQEMAGMQPSLMPNPETQIPQQPIQQQAPTTTETQYQQPQQEYYTPQPQAYSEEGYSAPQENYETETISEIAEQVATEKIEDYKAKVGDMQSFKSQIQNKVDDIDDRLKRIENSIDDLQQAILGKIGDFGESSEMVHKDLENLHNTVSKLMNPLIDNINEMKKIAK